MYKCFPFLKACSGQADSLDKRHASLQSVPDDVFRNGRTLEECMLDSNQIKELPKKIFAITQLKRLTLSDNALTRIPPNIGNLTALIELDVSRNEISDFPENIKFCSDLRVLDISSNPIQGLPPGMCQLKHLTQLNLNDITLSELPPEFGNLTALRRLELRDNLLKALPASFASLQCLEFLDLGGNEFTELPPLVGQLRQLGELFLDSNELKGLPPQIGQLKRLFQLDVSENFLESLPDEMAGLTALTDLTLTQNSLDTLPDGVGQLRNLSMLKLDSNRLITITAHIGYCSGLEELHLTDNLLSSLPATMGNLNRLINLNVDRNRLASLVPEIGRCRSLNILSLRDNRLTMLPNELGDLADLHVLDVAGNCLARLPLSLTNCQLKALWLSDKQAQPIITLQNDVDEETGEPFLTCYMLPQEGFEPGQQQKQQQQQQQPEQQPPPYHSPPSYDQTKPQQQQQQQQEEESPSLPSASAVARPDSQPVAFRQQQQQPPQTATSPQGYAAELRMSSNRDSASLRLRHPRFDKRNVDGPIIHHTEGVKDLTFAPKRVSPEPQETPAPAPASRKISEPPTTAGSANARQSASSESDTDSSTTEDSSSSGSESDEADEPREQAPAQMTAIGVHQQPSGPTKTWTSHVLSTEAEQPGTSGASAAAKTPSPPATRPQPDESDESSSTSTDSSDSSSSESEESEEAESQAKRMPPPTPPPTSPPKQQQQLLPPQQQQQKPAPKLTPAAAADKTRRGIEEEFSSGGEEIDQLRHVGFSEETEDNECKTPSLKRRDTPHYNKNARISKGQDPQYVIKVIEKYKGSGTAASPPLQQPEVLRVAASPQSPSATPAVGGHSGRQFKIVIDRKPGMSLGISIAGGLGSSPWKPGDHSIFLSKVVEGKPAYMAGLRPGDRLLEVNEQSMVQAEHNSAVEAMKKCGSQMRLLVERDGAHEDLRQEPEVEQQQQQQQQQQSPPPQLSSLPEMEEANPQVELRSDCFTVTLNRQQERGGGLGFSIAGGRGSLPRPISGDGAENIYISRVTPGGAAEAAKLQVGDRIMKINGSDVQSCSHEEAVSMLKNASSVQLEVARDAVLQSSGVGNHAASSPANGESLPPLEAERSPYPIEDVLLRTDGGQMGLSICGGCDHASHPFGVSEPGVFVSKIVPGGAASRTSLRVGDRILMVNGRDTRKSAHHEAVEALTENRHQIQLRVRHDPPPPGMQVLTIRKAEQAKRLGITISGGLGSPPANPNDATDEGVFVSRLTAGGVFSQDGRIQPGMRLLEANGRTLLGVTREEAVAILRDLPAEIRITVCDGFDPSGAAPPPPPPVSSRPRRPSSGSEGRPRLESTTSIDRDEEVENLKEMQSQPEPTSQMTSF